MINFIHFKRNGIVKYIIVFLQFITIALIYSQENDMSQIDLIPDLIIGEVKYYRIDKENCTEKNNSKSFFTSSSIVRCEVVDKTDDSYTIKLCYSDFNSSELGNIDKKEAEFVKHLMEYQIIYRIDNYGNYVDVINKSDINNYLANLISILKESVADQKTYDLYYSKVIQNYNNSDKYLNIFLIDIKLIHSFYGKSYGPNVKKSFPSKVVFPFTGKAINAVSTIETKSSFDNSKISFQYDTITNDEDLNDAVNALKNSFTDEERQRIKSSMFDLSNIQYKVNITYCLPDCLLKIYTYEMDTIILDQSRITKTTISEIVDME